MMRFHAPFFARATALLLASSAVLNAHPGHEGDHDLTWGFTGGLLHPLGGLDHVLAMLAVGWWAANRADKARWLAPMTFLVMMALGSLLNLGEGAVTLIEQGIAASLLAFGLMLASSKRLPLGLGLGVIGLFAVFHGAAHGGEAPASANGLIYGAGFLISTAFLILGGLGLGGTKMAEAAWLRRSAAGAVAVTGLVLLVT